MDKAVSGKTTIDKSAIKRPIKSERGNLMDYMRTDQNTYINRISQEKGENLNITGNGQEIYKIKQEMYEIDQDMYEKDQDMHEKDQEMFEKGSLSLSLSVSSLRQRADNLLKGVDNLRKRLDYLFLRFINWCDITYLQLRTYRLQTRKQILGYLPGIIAKPISLLIDRISQMRTAIINYGSTPRPTKSHKKSEHDGSICMLATDCGVDSVNAKELNREERGDVPGWVLVVLMTTGLVTAIWTIAAPRLSTILRNSLDSMNGIR